MTEEEARDQVARAVPRETIGKLNAFAALVIAENAHQNLVAPSTLPVMWSRHILDSAQLIWLAGDVPGAWLDIGSGGGFPGIVAGLMRPQPTLLIEPRAKRAAFLRDAAATLGIEGHVTVLASRVETAPIVAPVAIVTARAVAALPALFAMALPHTDRKTIWLLPKGKSAPDEVAQARREWQGEMSLVPSLSDPDSAIVVAWDMRRRRG